MDEDRKKNKGSHQPGKNDRPPRQADEPVAKADKSAAGKAKNKGAGGGSGDDFWDGKVGNVFDDNKPGKKMSRLKKGLLVAAGVLLLIVAATGTYVMAFYSQVQETRRVLLDEATFEEAYDVDAAFAEHIVNIALLGFDRGWGREALGEYLFRPDMLAVMSIDFEQDQISVVRIPRDSYVPIYNQGGFHDKINHSYYFGYRRGGGEDSHADGIRYTLQTVSNVLGGIPIHYYVSVDMYSIIELVDAMGGVYYEVEETIYDLHWDVGRVLVPEGPQIMDGKTYLRYLQYRDNKTSQDYGRIDRQMNLLRETYFYLREKGRITDIPTTYRIYKDYVETDLTYKQIAALAFYANSVDISDDNLHFYTIKGGGQMKDGIWYQVIDQNQRVQIVKDVFGIDIDPWLPIVLKDSPEYLEEQERKRRLEEMGLEEGEEPEEWPWDSIFDRNDDDDDEAAEEEDLSGLVMVPDVWGKSADEARAVLESSGLRVGEVIERYYKYLGYGLAIHSEPLAGKRVEPGSVINLVVSLGPNPEEN